jgi:hypothetical protein
MEIILKFLNIFGSKMQDQIVFVLVLLVLALALETTTGLALGDPAKGLVPSPGRRPGHFY